MAVYATLAQAQALYGTSYIAVACDRDNSGAVDTDSFNKHLSTASREMDAYLLGRYPLPLATPPEHFQKLCVDIAVYNGTPTADVCSEQIKDRHKAAIEYMKLIATNKVKLELATDATAVNASQETTLQTRHTLQLMSGSREMRRENLRKLM